MKPKHPVGPAYDRASDRLNSWRKNQEAKLTAEQRKEYDRLTILQATQVMEKKRRFATERKKLVQEETRRLLQEKPGLALKMLPGRPLKEKKAREMAQGIVQQRHTQEIKTLQHRHQQERDSRLHDFAGDWGQEAGKEGKSSFSITPELSAAFKARAAQKKAERDRGG